jgi:pyrimidine deaminase RibD-like protein
VRTWWLIATKYYVRNNNRAVCVLINEHQILTSFINEEQKKFGKQHAEILLVLLVSGHMVWIRFSVLIRVVSTV